MHNHVDNQESDRGGQAKAVAVMTTKLHLQSISPAPSIMRTPVLSSYLFELPCMRTGFAQRSFTYSAPHIWNSLPYDIIDNLNITTSTLKKTEVVLLHHVVSVANVSPAPAISSYFDRHMAR